MLDRPEPDPRATPIGWAPIERRDVDVARNGRAWGAGATAAAAALVLAGCSASVAPGTAVSDDPFSRPVVPGAPTAASGTGGQSGAAQSGWQAPTPRRGHGTVTAVVPAGSELPEDAVRDFLRATGFTLVQVPTDPDALGSATALTGADVVVGLDATQAWQATSAHLLAGATPQDALPVDGTELAEAPAAVAYARDDVCVLADTQWFAANKARVPSTLDELAAKGTAGLLVIPDPATSVAGRAFVQATAAATGSGAAAWWNGLLAAGATVATPAAATAAWTAPTDAPASADKPLTVATQSTAAHTLNNTGTESSSAAIAATCLRRDLYTAATAAPANADGAESLMAWLQGDTAQQTLVAGAVASPLDESLAADSPIGWFATPGDKARTLTADQVRATPGWLKAWTQVLSSR